MFPLVFSVRLLWIQNKVYPHMKQSVFIRWRFKCISLCVTFYRFEGVLYYSTWASDQSKGQILLAWMDGTHRRVFVDECTNKTACNEIKWPSSLTIDHIDRKLYWCDSRNARIERINLDGKNREVVLQRSTNGNFYPSMAYHNDFIFFTDTTSGNILKVGLRDAAKRE